MRGGFWVKSLYLIIPSSGEFERTYFEPARPGAHDGIKHPRIDDRLCDGRTVERPLLRTERVEPRNPI
jgi:hypothetical protein